MEDTRRALHFEITASNEDIKKKLAETRRQLLDSGKTAEAMANQVHSTFQRAISGAFKGFSAAGFVKQLAAVNNKLQQYQAVLSDTFQSPAQAQQAMAQIHEFAATTPFEIDELTAAFVKLANEGFVPTYDQMTKLGDLASATGKGFDELAEAIVAAQTGAFERLSEFGVVASTTGNLVTFTFREQATQMDFTASAIRNYILSLGDLIGVQGANAEFTRGLTEQMRGLEVAIAQMFNAIGQSSEMSLSNVSGPEPALVDKYEAVGQAIEALSAAYDVYQAALMATVVIQKLASFADNIQLVIMFRKELGLLTAAQQAFNLKAMLNPYAIAAVAVAALAYGIYQLCTAQSAAERAQEALNKAMEESKQKREALASKSNEQIGAIRSETNTRYMQTKAFRELQKEYPALFKNMSMEQLLLMDKLELQRLINAEIDKKEEKDLPKNLTDAQAKYDKLKASYDVVTGLRNRMPSVVNIVAPVVLGDYVEDAAADVKAAQDMIEEHRQIIADIRPVEAKVFSLDSNIKLLETQLTQIEGLESEFKKLMPWLSDAENNPLWPGSGETGNAKPAPFNFFGQQQQALNGQIAAKRAERDALIGGKEVKPVKNKEYWEKQRAEIQKEIDAMDVAEKGTQDWIQKQNELAQVNAKLKAWDFSNTTPANTTEELKKLNESLLSSNAKLEAEKTAILEDGKAKRLKLSAQERDEKITALTKEYNDTVAAYAKIGQLTPTKVTDIYTARMGVEEQAKTKRDTAIEDEYKKEFEAREKALTDVTLSEETKRMAAIKEKYDNERKWAEDRLKEGVIDEEQYNSFVSSANTSEQYENLTPLLEKYQTYTDKRIAIESQFNAEIDAMAAKNTDGKYNEQIAQAESERDKKLSALGTENLLASDEAQMLFGNLDALSAKSITSIATSLRAKAQEQFQTGTLGENAYIDLLDRIGEAEEKAMTKNPFALLADAAKGAFSKIDKDDAAAVAKRKASWKKLGESMGASLSIASEAMQGVGSIADALGADEETQATIAQLSGVLSGASDLAKGLASGDVSAIIKGAAGMITSMIDLFDFRSKRANRIINEEEENIKRIQKQYKDLERTIKSALGTDYFQKQVDSAKLLQQQIESIDNQIAAEQSKRKRKRDDGQIEAWEEEQKDLQQQIADIKQGVVDELSTTDLKSYSMDLSSSLIEGMANGVEDMGGIVDEKMDTLLKNIIAKQFDMLVTQKAMQPMFDAMAEGFDETSENGFGLSDAEMREIVREGNNGKAKITSSLDSYKRMMEELGLVNEEVSEAAQGAKGEIMASMTEETGSELVGMIRLQVDKLHAMEFTSASQFEFLKLGWQNIAEMARTNAEIAANTFRTANNTDCLSASLESMNTKLASIDKNTKPTYSK